MRYKNLVDVIGTILLVVGFLLAFLPHATHVAVGLEETSHLQHVIFGIALVVVGLGILVYNNKALKLGQKSAKV